MRIRTRRRRALHRRIDWQLLHGCACCGRGVRFHHGAASACWPNDWNIQDLLLVQGRALRSADFTLKVFASAATWDQCECASQIVPSFVGGILTAATRPNTIDIASAFTVTVPFTMKTRTLTSARLRLLLRSRGVCRRGIAPLANPLGPRRLHTTAFRTR